MSSSSWTSSEDYRGNRNPYEIQPSKSALKWVALGLEALAVLLVIAAAVYLRLAHLHPDTADINWKVLCEDITLYLKPADDNSTLLYILVLVVPSVFILTAEIEHSLFSKKSYFNNMSQCMRIRKNLPRMVRISAMFVLGVMSASFTIDYLQTLIVQPRPYFLTLYGANCPSPFNGTITEDFFEALKSFPSHLAGIAGFCCVFAVGYVHKVRSSRRTPILLSIVSLAFFVLAATTSLDSYTSHLNHLFDIVGGLFIGLVLGLYMISLLSRLVWPKQAEEEPNYWPNFLEFMIPRVTLPPTSTDATANNRRMFSQVPSQLPVPS